MLNLKPGDRVDCRIKSNVIVSTYRGYDEVKTFEIVAIESYGYYLYVPHYYFLKGTVVADKYQCKRLGINNKFLNENIIYIEEGTIHAIREYMDGLPCKKCHEFFSYAESNQEDGTLICYSCRQNPYI